jgi:hypothetical protein
MIVANDNAKTLGHEAARPMEDGTYWAPVRDRTAQYRGRTDLYKIGLAAGHRMHRISAQMLRVAIKKRNAQGTQRQAFAVEWKATFAAHMDAYREFHAIYEAADLATRQRLDAEINNALEP